MRRQNRMRSKLRVILIIAIMLIILACFMQTSPEGFQVIMSVSPSYYNTIGAPAEESPEYRQEQQFNIAMMADAAPVKTNDKEVKLGAYALRLAGSKR